MGPGRLVGRCIDLLERGQVAVVAQALLILANAEAGFEHAVDAARKLRRLIKDVPRGEKRGIEQKPNQVCHPFV